MIPHNKTPLESSTISSVQFFQNKHDSDGTLHVEFTSGKTYKYSNVPAKHAEGLVHASSPGTYHRDNIASGNFKAEKV